MKTFLVALLTIFSAGCFNYTAAQVGPDRFSISSRQSNYTPLLKMAYDQCRLYGHKDYSILYTINDNPGTTIIVQCVDSPVPPKETKNDTTTAPQTQPTTQTNETPSTIQKIYQDFKDSFK